MGRLTSWNKEKCLLINEEERLLTAKGFIDKDEMYKIMRHLAEKLADYEDLEEQGLLLKLPCKVWDDVYETDEFEREITKRKVYSIEIDDYGVAIMVSEPNGCSPYTARAMEDFGKTVFLTRAEAEEALMKMNGGIEDGIHGLQKQ